MVKQVRGL
jgi:cupin 2 domain-containing protein